jgi:DNA-binding NtrC family response regulator
MTRPRVLVVEDRASVLKLMRTVLGKAYEVTCVSDGDAAMSAFEEAIPDVVLTDIRMPRTSGFEVLRAVRERAPGTAVVMMTAYANVPDAVGAIKEGAFDYVAKPIDGDEILLVVARALEHRRWTEGERDAAAPTVEPEPRRVEDAAGVSTGFHRAVEEARARASREYLTELMRLYGGHVTHAAGRAGMTRESLHRVLRKYGIRHEHADGGEAGAIDPGGDGRGARPPAPFPAGPRDRRVRRVEEA